MVASKKKDETGRGKIIDQNKRREEESKFGKMSEVIVLKGMLRGMDSEEIMSGVLQQEIGEECGEKYGMVERVYIDVAGAGDEQGPRVYVQFTSQLSALRVGYLSWWLRWSMANMESIGCECARGKAVQWQCH